LLVVVGSVVVVLVVVVVLEVLVVVAAAAGISMKRNSTLRKRKLPQNEAGSQWMARVVSE
jgi:hypothetical protein